MKEILLSAAGIALIVLIFCAEYIFQKKGIIRKSSLKSSQYVFILLTLTLIFSAFRLHDGHDWGGDFSCYIAQAKSILNGTMNEQVETNTYIVSNSYYQHGPFAYPWGYPLIIAVIIKFFGLNFVALKVLNIVAFLGTVLILYFFISEKTNPKTAFFSTALFSLSSFNMKIIDFVLTDVIFIFLSVASLYAIDRLYRSDKKQALWAVIIGFTAFGTFFVRTIGLVSFLTVAFTDSLLICGKLIKPVGKITEKIKFTKQKISVHLIIYFIFAACFFAVNKIFPSGESGYAYYFKDFSLHSIVSNIITYTKSILISFDVGKILSVAVFAVFAILAVYSIIKHFFDYFHILVYCAGTIAVLILFPASNGIRYLIPVIPLLYLFAFLTWDKIISESSESKDFSKKSAVKCGLCISVVLSALILTVYGNIEYSFLRIAQPEKVSTNEAYTDDAIKMYDYIKENTSEDDIIVFFKPRVLWLNAERKSFSVSDNNIEKIRNVNYILNTDESPECLTEAVKSSEDFTEVYQSGELRLYKNNHPVDKTY